MKPAARFLTDQRGATSIEYGLLAFGIFLVIVVVIESISNTVLRDYFNVIAAAFTGR